MPEETSKITIIADLLKRDPAYKQTIDQLEERLYNRYMVYLADKPRFNAKTQAIPKQYLAQILSFKNTLELSRIAKKYNLSQEQRDDMPAIMWKIFWRDADIKNLPQMLNSEAAINNIHTAYLLAGDVAQIYMPISDYLGDIPMVIKRWQFEIPAEPAANYQPPAISQSQPKINLSTSILTIPVVPPIRQPGIAALPPVARNGIEPKDESIARVQETMARISGQMAKIQQPPKSEIEPEYLPDEASAKAGLPDEKPVHSANIVDLKNF